ncbi:MAG: hypothetical protein HOP13_19205 [Alphaproteobacteria bacterium]|nr:hypothetical protein [Alphaproteobacteria bacterium]
MHGRWLTDTIKALRDARSYALVVALLAAFVAQSIVTTAHVHQPGVAATALDSVHADAKHQAASADTHRSGDAVQCPLCQLAARTGSFLAAAHGIVPLVRDAILISFDAPLIGVERFAAPWRSRAPPSL